MVTLFATVACTAFALNDTDTAVNGNRFFLLLMVPPVASVKSSAGVPLFC
jgi:hypothetical protein